MRAPEALDRMLAGELVDAPEEVRELAELATMLQGTWQGEPTTAQTTRAKTAAMEAFAVTAAGPTVVQVRPSRPRRIFARVALAAALVGVGLPGVAWAASENALPGEVLYPVKRAFEEAQIAVAGNPADEAAVLLEIAAERLREAAMAQSRELENVVEQALAGFRDALGRFEDRLQAAQALDLPLDGLVQRSLVLSTQYQRILEALSEEPPNPTITTVAPADDDPGKGKAKGKGKGKAKGKGRGNQAQGRATPPRPGPAPQGGGGGRAGQRDRDRDREARQENTSDDGASDEAEAEGHDDPGEGKGLGHVKAKGKGHQKHDD